MQKRKTPKILMVANTDWYLYNFRMELIRSLIGRGWEVVLVSPSGPYSARFVSEGITWREWQVGRQSIAPWREIRSILALGRIYQEEQPDLVHLHTNKAVIYGSLAAVRCKTARVVNSIPGRGYVFCNTDPKAVLLRPIVRALFKMAFKGKAIQAVVFENSSDQQYFIQSHLISEKFTHLIPSVGVNIDQYPYSSYPEGTPIVVMASRMLWEKGVGIFVQAAEILQRDLDVRMVLVGMPDTGNPTSIPETTLQNWVRRGAVEWWGWREDMPGVYQQSALVVHPTTYGEGVPTVLLEAGSSGRPVIATDWPGCRAAVLEGRTGLLVPPKDSQALADAIRALLSKPNECVQMGRAGREFVSEHFSTKAVNQATLSIYRKVLME